MGKSIFGMKVARSDTMRPLPACWNNVSMLQWRARQQTCLVSLTDSTLTPRLVALVPPLGFVDIFKKFGDKSDQDR
jgi:hypothetical protein